MPVAFWWYVVPAVLAVYGATYLRAWLEIRGTGRSYRLSRWTGLLFAGASPGPRALLFAGAACVTCALLVALLPDSLRELRHRRSECRHLLDPEVLAQVTHRRWRVRESGDRRGGEGCYAGWAHHG
ncbi:MAG: hypothetical protein ACK4N5_18870, partial [Myxococcales bacterium]